MNREVNLTKKVQTPYGWRYCRVVFSAKGRIKPDLAVVNGKQECHEEGAYYLEWREGSKCVRLSVGKDPADASARRQRKAAELNAINNGVPVSSPDGQNGRRMVSMAVARLLEETKLIEKSKTHAAHDTSLRYFMESCPKLYLEDLQRSDLLKFAAFLRDEKELHPRNLVNQTMGKRQPMCWSLEGAHLLLQVRCAMLDNRLDARFREWYPQFRQMPAPVELPIICQTAPHIETVSMA
jgi:hypothetical protein